MLAAPLPLSGARDGGTLSTTAELMAEIRSAQTKADADFLTIAALQPARRGLARWQAVARRAMDGGGTLEAFPEDQFNTWCARRGRATITCCTRTSTTSAGTPCRAPHATFYSVALAKNSVAPQHER